MIIKYTIKKNLIILIIFLAAFYNTYQSQGVAFNISESEQGILIEEEGKQVLFYQKELKSLNGKYARNNYIHPLYSLDGDTLTADFPEDHPFHRGIFWSWHQVYINDSSISDPWVLKDHNCKVVKALTSTENSKAEIKTEAFWSSPKYLHNTPYLKENARVTVYPKSEGLRIIDFQISLLALVEGLKIGGSADEKGYGGFCPRIVTPDDLIFMSDSGKITPQKLQVKAGSWMDFSGTFNKENGVTGITLFCHPSNPNYPQPWILRQKKSMQNVVYPGQEPVEISMKEPVVLNYRLIIHTGSADVEKITDWKNKYYLKAIN